MTKLSYTTEEASEATGIPKRKLVTMCKAKELPAVKIGKHWIIPCGALLALLNIDEPKQVANG